MGAVPIFSFSHHFLIFPHPFSPIAFSFHFPFFPIHLKAVINHISKRGAIVHLELNAHGNRELFEVELSREGFRSLGLEEGETVYDTGESQDICRHGHAVKRRR